MQSLLVACVLASIRLLQVSCQQQPSRQLPCSTLLGQHLTVVPSVKTFIELELEHLQAANVLLVGMGAAVGPCSAASEAGTGDMITLVRPQVLTGVPAPYTGVKSLHK